MVQKTGITIPQHVGEAAEINYGGQPAADYGPLARDRIPVRSMAEAICMRWWRSIAGSPAATAPHISNASWRTR